MTGRDNFDDEPLDVVELLAEDDDRRTEPVDDEDRPRALSRRGIIAIAAVALAAIVAVSITFADGPDDDSDVGIESPSSTRGTETTAAPPRDDPPEITPGPFVASVGGPIAISRNGELFVLDPARPAFDRLRNAGGLGVNVVAAVDGSLLVSDDDSNLVIFDDDTVVQVGTTTVFPSSDGAGWWRADGPQLTAIGRVAEAVDLPAGTRAISALREGFLLADNESGLLVRWTPGTEPTAIEGTGGATVAAVHPDRVAWYGDCAGSPCALHVTDVATARSVTIPTVMPIFGSGTASGRFAPDGSRLALMATASTIGSAVQSELVVVDLAAGTIVRREPLDGPALLPNMPPYLQPVPFDFTRDPTRLVLADWTGRQRQLVTIDLTSGDREPSNNTLRGITSVVTLGNHIVPATRPLAPPVPLGIDAVVAMREYVQSELTLFDLATSTQRTLVFPGESRTNGPFGPNLVAVRSGFVTTANGLAQFVRFDGTVTEVGAADWVVASSDRSRAWIFGQRGDGAYDVRSVDGTTGETRPERSVGTVPRFVVGDDFVQLVPASFDRPARIERWNVRTGTSRFVDVDGIGSLVAATDRHAVGQSASCYERGLNCELHVLDLDTGDATPVATNSDPYVPPNSAAGDSLYLTEAGTGLVRLDLGTGMTEVVPGSVGTEQWAVAASGTVLFSTAEGLYAWVPGAADRQLVAPGRLESETGIQFAVG